MRGYLQPRWKTLPRCPFPLSDIYTPLDMEFIEGNSSRPLEDYTELFEGINGLAPAGPRILVQAEPGKGKTMFTHKLALDWAEKKRLTEFDLLLIVKLRHLTPDEPIPQAITTQMQIEEEISPQDLENRLIRSGKKVLLVLDGLDDVDLKKYPQLMRILSRRDYSRCCVLTTCKPHVFQQVSHYMTRTARITGFSKSSAQKFVSYIIPDENERYQFFIGLIERNMYEMYTTPRLLQALAFMYASGGHRLSNTYTEVYDDLLLNVRKACEGSEELSAVEIDEAVNDINKLAFDGLTRNTKHPGKIMNKNIFKFGILSGTKFLHTTLRAYSIAGFITSKLKQGNRDPWEMIKERYVHDIRVSDSSKFRFQIPLCRDVIDIESLTSATQKFVNNIVFNEKGQVASIRILLKVAVGFLEDDEVDREKLLKICRLIIPKQASFDEKEMKTTVHFLADFLSRLDRKLKEKYKDMINDLIDSDETYFAYVSDIRKRMNKNPQIFTETMMAITQQIVSSGEELTLQSVNKELLWLRHQANSMKGLFRFIMGKLRGSGVDSDVLKEIGELLVTNAIDNNNGQALSVSFLKQYIQHLMEEGGIPSDTGNMALFTSDTCTINNTTVDIPAVLCIKRIIPELRESNVSSTVLKLYHITGNLSPSIKLIEKLNYLSVVELYRIKKPDSRKVEQLAECLRRRRIVSVHMEDLDTVLSKAVVSKLSPTALRLSLKDIPTTCDYSLPAEVDLKSLYIEESLSGVSQIFQSMFHHLRSLSVVSKFTWSRRDLASLQAAVLEERMPHLQTLVINHGSLRNRMQYILNIMEANTCQISTTDLEDTNLSTYDGELLLAALRQERLGRVHCLYLSRNADLQPLIPEIAQAAERLGYLHIIFQHWYHGPKRDRWWCYIDWPSLGYLSLGLLCLTAEIILRLR